MNFVDRRPGQGQSHPGQYPDHRRGSGAGIVHEYRVLLRMECFYSK